MDSKIKKLVATVALVGAVSVGTAGIAAAAEGGGTASDPSAQTAKGHPFLRRAVRRGAVKVVTEALGVSQADLRAAVKGGQSVSEYATSLGKDPAAVTGALVDAANARIDQLVADGKIQQDRADTIKGKVPARVDKLMNRHFGDQAPAQAQS
jgi:ABC-type amino acid transport substrate-binding protein